MSILLGVLNGRKTLIGGLLAIFIGLNMAVGYPWISKDAVDGFLVIAGGFLGIGLGHKAEKIKELFTIIFTLFPDLKEKLDQYTTKDPKPVEPGA